MIAPQMKCIVLEEKDDPEAQWFAFQYMLCGPSQKHKLLFKQGD